MVDALPALVDAFGRTHTYLRVSVTDRCNLRCAYCMPREGVAHKPREAILRFEEIRRLVRLLARMGIRKVRLTGGEPLVRRDVELLVRMLADVEGIETVGLTTNGVLLARHTNALKRAGLTSVNVSLDTLRPERFARIALRPYFHEVLHGIDAALAAGFAPVKLNVVVLGGTNDDELLDFVELARDRPLEVRFIEYMPFRGNGWGRAALVPWAAMRSAIETAHALVPLETDGSRVCRTFRIEGFAGTVGFIASMTDHFCGGCNRLRLTADGTLKTCLFSPGELDLRGALRRGAGDEQLERLIRAAVAAKPAQHVPASMLAAAAGRSMVEIGG